jgi:hypothetical protein
VEPICVPASELQEVLNQPHAGDAPKPARTTLHAVSPLSSTRFFKWLLRTAVAFKYICVSVLIALTLNLQPIPIADKSTLCNVKIIC